jgi:predicted secreted acid phosphatase
MDDIFNSLVETFKTEIQYYDNNNFKPCVVFDIDGTILVDGIYSPSNSREIISDIYKFLLYLQNKNIDIFIITARPDFSHNRLSTIKMLNKINIKYKYLYMWNQNIFDNQIIFKGSARKEIFHNKYNIIMSLGDNYWDYGLYGGLGVHIYEDGKDIEYIRDFL